jgi:hypothetical protein
MLSYGIHIFIIYLRGYLNVKTKKKKIKKGVKII